MKPRILLTRILGLFLSIGLTLPHPALALRQENVLDNVGLEEAVSTALGRPAGAAGSEGIRVLVVSNDGIFHHGVARALKERVPSAIIDPVYTAMEARERAQGAPYDVVIAVENRHRHPGDKDKEPGRELLRDIKKRHPASVAILVDNGENPPYTGDPQALSGIDHHLFYEADMNGKMGGIVSKVAEKKAAAGLEEGSYPRVEPGALGVGVLLGAVSNTLKDMMRGRGGLDPKGQYVVVLPPRLFDEKTKRVYGEMEFLVYFNAFVRGGIFKPSPQGIQVVGTQEQLDALKEYLKHTIFGPEWENGQYPWVPEQERRLFKAMRDHYAIRDKAGRVIPIEGYLEAIPFDSRGTASVPVRDQSGTVQGTLRVAQRVTGREVTAYAIKEQVNGEIKSLGDLPVRYDHPYPVKYPVPESFRKDLERGRFGFARTWIGTSTGFDPLGDTTSMPLWLEGIGIWVDPSHEGLQYLKDLGLTEEDVPYVFLSHVHQDHDGGVLERVLRGKKVKLIASRIVYEEFLIKARLLLKFVGRRIDPKDLVEWVPLDPGKPFRMKLPSGRTATFRSWWNLHPIPTNGFGVTYDGFRYAHSGDTQWDPAFIQKLADGGKLTSRQAQGQKFRFFTKQGRPRYDFVDHEAGGPPIHTTLESLAALPEETRRRLAIYHVPDAKVEERFGLRKAKMFETEVFVPSDEERKKGYALGVLATNALLKDRSSDFRDVFLRLAHYEKIQPGQRLTVEGHSIRVVAYNGIKELSSEGPPGSEDRGRAYFIVGGRAGVYVGDRKVAELGPGEQFGDWSIVNKQPRSATVVAEAPLEVYSLTPEAYNVLFGDDATRKGIQELEENIGLLHRWSQKTTSQAFHDLSYFASVILAGKFEERTYAADEDIVTEGQPGDEFFIIKEGAAEVIKGFGPASHVVAHLAPADDFGQIAILREVERTATVRAARPTKVLVLKGKEFNAILNHFPLIKIGQERAVEKMIQDLVRDYFRRPSIRGLVANEATFRVILAQMAHRHGWDRVHAMLGLADKTIVDLASGPEGKIVQNLRGLGFGHAIGVDLAADVTKSYVLKGDISDLKGIIPDGAVDVALITGFLGDDPFYGEHPKEFYEGVAREIGRILKPGAQLYLVTLDEPRPILQDFEKVGLQINVLIQGVYEITNPKSVPGTQGTGSGTAGLEERHVTVADVAKVPAQQEATGEGLTIPTEKGPFVITSPGAVGFQSGVRTTALKVGTKYQGKRLFIQRGVQGAIVPGSLEGAQQIDISDDPVIARRELSEYEVGENDLFILNSSSFATPKEVDAFLSYVGSRPRVVALPSGTTGLTSQAIEALAQKAQGAPGKIYFIRAVSYDAGTIYLQVQA